MSATLSENHWAPGFLSKLELHRYEISVPDYLKICQKRASLFQPKWATVSNSGVVHHRISVPWRLWRPPHWPRAQWHPRSFNWHGNARFLRKVCWCKWLGEGLPGWITVRIVRMLQRPYFFSLRPHGCICWFDVLTWCVPPVLLSQC